MPNHGPAPRILVIRRRYVGDLILLEPLLRNLRDAYPQAHLTLVADEGYAETLRHCDSLDEIATIPSRGPAWQRLIQWRTLWGRLREQRFDIAFDLARNEQAALVLLLSRARRRISVEIEGDPGVRRRKKLDVWRRRLLATDLVRTTREKQIETHMVDWNNQLAAPLGIATPHRLPRVPVPESNRQAARLLLEECLKTQSRDQPLILLHPGGRGEGKRWATTKFAEVSDALTANPGCRTLVAAGPGEQELARAVCDATRESGTHLLKTPVSLAVFYGLLAEADVFLGNDSGPAHMAAAVGTPTCTLFGATRPAIWHTLGPWDETLRPPMPCAAACIRPEVCRPGGRQHCVQRVTASEVLATMRRILDKVRDAASRTGPGAHRHGSAPS